LLLEVLLNERERIRGELHQADDETSHELAFEEDVGDDGGECAMIGRWGGNKIMVLYIACGDIST
jgi:hypothetical protein